MKYDSLPTLTKFHAQYLPDSVGLIHVSLEEMLGEMLRVRCVSEQSVTISERKLLGKRANEGKW